MSSLVAESTVALSSRGPSTDIRGSYCPRMSQAYEEIPYAALPHRETSGLKRKNRRWSLVWEAARLARAQR